MIKQKYIAESVKVRTTLFKMGYTNVKSNRDGTFTVMLDSDKTNSVATNKYTISRKCLQPFQVTMDKRGRISMCVSVPDTSSEGCNVHLARSSSSISNGVWTNVAIVSKTNKNKDGGELKLYIDGVVDAEVRYSGKLLKKSTKYDAGINICGTPTEGGPESYIKDVKILAEELSTKQIIEYMRTISRLGDDLSSNISNSSRLMSGLRSQL